MNLKEIRNTEYSKCVDLLTKLIDLDENTKKNLQMLSEHGDKKLFYKS